MYILTYISTPANPAYTKKKYFYTFRCVRIVSTYHVHGHWTVNKRRDADG